MELIYETPGSVDVGIIEGASLDLAYGVGEDGEDSFDLTASPEYTLVKNARIYIEGTEYGGVVRERKSRTKNGDIVWKGQTWHGILADRVICPDSGADHYIVSGDLNTIIGTVISRLGLGYLFTAATVSSGITTTGYQFYRYVDGYNGLRGLCNSKGAKLHLEYDQTLKKVILSAVAIHDYSTDEELSSDLFSFVVVDDMVPVNHLICMGTGELKDRLRVDLYADASGNVSQTQSITGEDLRELYYDDNNSDHDQLVENGTKKLKELQETSSVKVDVNDDTFSADIDDIIGGHDYDTGIDASASITKKIVKLENDVTTVEYTSGTNTGHISLVENAETMDIREIAATADSAMATAKDAATVSISSSHGLVFKDNAISTLLTCYVFRPGGERIENIADLQTAFGSSAHIEWRYKRNGDADWGTILSSDSRISRSGFDFAVSPADVDEKTSFEASVVID